ncbi:unnamed protein product [Adineta steineri]|uniref:Mono(ADP-ribosyl)transferase n=1 Tax=Adineta steineri TaxID=433720 RepID=A0A815H9X8_9BILA|nr:unnamed protein product [Adineta steineri]CAF4002346.1 unnamed protein product [Adineta steineri]
MLDLCRSCCENNEAQLRQIQEYEEDGGTDKVINWYTKDSFVYRFCNKALRTNHIRVLFIFRYLIRDISRSLARLHKKTQEKEYLLYRGVIMPYAELCKMKPGMLLAYNSFLSTTTQLGVADMYASTGIYQQTGDCVSVLYHINVDNRHQLHQKKKQMIFADVHDTAAIQDEEEVLFDISSTFEIESIEYDAEITRQVWNVIIRSTSKGEELIDTLLRENPEQTTRLFMQRCVEWHINCNWDLLEGIVDIIDTRLDTEHEDKIYRAGQRFFNADDKDFSFSSTLSSAFRMARSTAPVIIPTFETIDKSLDSYATLFSMTSELNHAIKRAKFLPHISRRQRIKRAFINAARNLVIRNSSLREH